MMMRLLSISGKEAKFYVLIFISSSSWQLPINLHNSILILLVLFPSHGALSNPLNQERTQSLIHIKIKSSKTRFKTRKKTKCRPPMENRQKACAASVRWKTLRKKTETMVGHNVLFHQEIMILHQREPFHPKPSRFFYHFEFDATHLYVISCYFSAGTFPFALPFAATILTMNERTNQNTDTCYQTHHNLPRHALITSSRIPNLPQHDMASLYV